MNADIRPQAKRGRPPGSPKIPGSGRRAGTPNEMTIAIRAEILQRMKPHEFLFRVMKGRPIRCGAPAAGPGGKFAMPNLAQMMDAAMSLLGKTIADKRETEVSG